MPAPGWTPVQDDTSAWKPVEEKQKEKPGPVQTFGRAAISRLNPINMFTGAVDTATRFADDPIGTMADMGPLGSAKRAYESVRAGDWPAAGAHVMAAVTPGGFMAEPSATKVAQGNVAEGLGEMTGDAVGALIGSRVPGMIGKAASGAKSMTRPLIRAGAGMAARSMGLPGAVGHVAAEGFLGKGAEVPPKIPPPMPMAPSQPTGMTIQEPARVNTPPPGGPAPSGPFIIGRGATAGLGEPAAPMADTRALDAAVKANGGKTFAALAASDPAAAALIKSAVEKAAGKPAQPPSRPTISAPSAITVTPEAAGEIVNQAEAAKTYNPKQPMDKGKVAREAARGKELMQQDVEPTGVSKDALARIAAKGPDALKNAMKLRQSLGGK